MKRIFMFRPCMRFRYRLGSVLFGMLCLTWQACNNQEKAAETVEQPAKAYSLFTNMDRPPLENTNQNDKQPIEVGVKFKTTVDGVVNGIRFYKGSEDSTVHVGNLWTNEGANMATASFDSVNGEGWKEVIFAAPVPVKAGQVYVASTFSPGGFYCSTIQSFNEEKVSGPLVALQNTDTLEHNGVFSYCPGDSSTFPRSGFSSPNYWVDVIFTPDKPLSDSISASANH